MPDAEKRGGKGGEITEMQLGESRREPGVLHSHFYGYRPGAAFLKAQRLCHKITADKSQGVMNDYYKKDHGTDGFYGFCVKSHDYSYDKRYHERRYGGQEGQYGL